MPVKFKKIIDLDPEWKKNDKVYTSPKKRKRSRIKKSSGINKKGKTNSNKIVKNFKEENNSKSNQENNLEHSPLGRSLKKLLNNSRFIPKLSLTISDNEKTPVINVLENDKQIKLHSKEERKDEWLVYEGVYNCIIYPALIPISNENSSLLVDVGDKIIDLEPVKVTEENKYNYITKICNKKSLVNEIIAMAQLKYNNICGPFKLMVPMQGISFGSETCNKIFHKINSKYITEASIVLYPYAGPNLLDWLNANFNNFTNNEQAIILKSFFKQLLKGFNILHSNGIYYLNTGLKNFCVKENACEKDLEKKYELSFTDFHAASTLENLNYVMNNDKKFETIQIKKMPENVYLSEIYPIENNILEYLINVKILNEIPQSNDLDFKKIPNYKLILTKMIEYLKQDSYKIFDYYKERTIILSEELLLEIFEKSKKIISSNLSFYFETIDTYGLGMMFFNVIKTGKTIFPDSKLKNLLEKMTSIKIEERRMPIASTV